MAKETIADPILLQNENEKTTLRIWPELAEEIGLNESIFLLQLEFLLRLPDSDDRKLKDGRRWIYGSIRYLKETYFDFWSKNTINRAINCLIKQNLIIEGNYNRFAYDRTRWFTLNLEAITELESIAVPNWDRLSQNGTRSNQNGTRSNQNGTRSNQNGTRSNQNGTTIPETTTETSTKTTTETSLKDDASSLEESQSTHLNQSNGHGPIPVTVEHLQKICPTDVGQRKLNVGQRKLKELVRWLAGARVDLVSLLAFAGWFAEQNGNLPDPRPQPKQVEENWLGFQDDVNVRSGGDKEHWAALLREYIYLFRSRTDLVDEAGNVVVEGKIVWKNPDYHEEAEIERGFSEAQQQLLREG